MDRLWKRIWWKQRLAKGALSFSALVFAACGTTQNPIRNYERTVPRFVFESVSPENVNKVVTLPVSQVQIQVDPNIVLSEYDVKTVEVAEIAYGKCLQFSLGSAASRDFYRASALHQGRRLVLLLNGEAIGVRKIETPVSNGTLLIFLEVPDETLPEVAKNLKGTIFEIQKTLNN